MFSAIIKIYAEKSREALQSIDTKAAHQPVLCLSVLEIINCSNFLQEKNIQYLDSLKSFAEEMKVNLIRQICTRTIKGD